jgi:penicillin-binding protein-related factor A (putative recombinase)
MQQSMFKRTDHSNLGKGFEAELAAAHDWYRMNHVIDIVQNHNLWEYAEGQGWHRARVRYESGDRTVARTGDGGFIIRQKSDVDFSGGGFVFDAKETSAERWPFSSIEDHQVLRLQQSKQCGSTSGIFIKFVKHDRVFWLGSPTLSAVFNKWMVASYGRRRAKPGEASLAISQLEEMGIEIFRHPVNKLWDWFERLKA